MAFQAKDGTPFTNMMGVNKRNASLAARPQATPDAGQGGDIQSNPEAMECVDKLKSMGFTADDVAQAMDGGGDQQQSAMPKSSPSGGGNAPINLPGL